MFKGLSILDPKLNSQRVVVWWCSFWHTPSIAPETYHAELLRNSTPCGSSHCTFVPAEVYATRKKKWAHFINGTVHLCFCLQSCVTEMVISHEQVPGIMSHPIYGGNGWGWNNLKFHKNYIFKTVSITFQSFPNNINIFSVSCLYMGLPIWVFICKNDWVETIFVPYSSCIRMIPTGCSCAWKIPFL